MRVRSVAVVVCALIALAGEALQGPDASAGLEQDRTADLAAIQKLSQQDIAATVARDPVALTDLWTDDAVRLGGGRADVGKKAIAASNERQTANKAFKVLSYVPETKDLTFLDGGWAVEWRSFTASYIDAPGGEAKKIRGTVLGVLKKLPDGSWKAFRAMGDTSQQATARLALTRLNANVEFMLGKCISTPERLPDGRLRFKEQWHWLSGDMSAGYSKIEEVAQTR